MRFFPLLRPLAHCLPPEAIHQLGLCALAKGLVPSAPPAALPALESEYWGLRFANPVGLAAGFDKNAVAVNALLRQGFGFVECGTVTPLPQQGNPRPRIFRLAEDKAVINRMGFPGEGLAYFIEHFKQRDAALGIAGVNIGKNKTSTDAVADYVTCLRDVYAYADYVTVNISSPNTQGLRDLQQREALAFLLSALRKEREACAQRHERTVPLLLKIAPDLSGQEREDVAEAVLAHGVDGLIVSNTTLDRPASLRSAHKGESGGLSGAPLFARSTEGLKHFYQLCGGRIPLIGVGGIGSAEDAYRKIRAGASLVQLYSALVYEGFGLVYAINQGLARLLQRDGLARVQDAVGLDAKI